MIVAAWILLLVLLTLFFNDRLEKQRNPNMQVAGSMTEQGMPSVTLKRNRFGHYVATGFINDRPVAEADLLSGRGPPRAWTVMLIRPTPRSPRPAP